MAGIAKRATIQIPIEMEGLEKLKSLNNSLDRITQRNSSFRKSFADTSKQLGKFNEQAQDFGKKYREMMESSTTANRDFTKTSKEMSKQFNEQQKEMQNAIDRTKQAQKENADSTVRSNGRIRNSHENIGRSIDSNHRKMDSMNNAGHNLMMTGMNMTMAFSGFTAAAKDGIQQATDLQDQYNKVRVLAQNGGEQPQEARRNTASLQRQGQKLATTYGIDQSQFSQGNEDLIRRGYTTSAAKGAQPEYSRAAIASGDDYNDVVHTGAGALEAFGQRSNNTKKMHNNTKRMLNQLTYGADLTASDYNDIGWALQYTGSTAHQSHQSSNQIIASLGELSQQNITGSKAGTSMRRIIEGLSNPKSKVLSTIGLSPKDFQDSHGNLKSISDDMQVLNSHMQGMTSTNRYNIFKSLFGMQGEQAAQILANNVKKVDDLNHSIKNAPNMNNGQGYNAKIAAQNMKTFKGESNIAKQNFKVMTSSVARQMLPDLAKIVGWGNHIFRQINHMSNGQKRMVGWGTVIIGAMGPVTLFLGTMLASIRSIRKAFSGLRRQMSAPMPSTASDSIGKQAAENEVSSSVMNPSVGTLGKSSKRGTFLQRNSSLFSHGAKEASHTPHISYAKGLNYGREGPEALSNMSKGASVIGRYGARGGTSRIVGPLTRGLSATRSISSRIPYLDVLASAAPLLGMKKKNAGSKIGESSGMLSGTLGGAKLGAIAGNAIPIPGVGAGVGSLVGGGLGGLAGSKLGKSLGNVIQKHMPVGAKKDLSSIGKSFQKLGKKASKYIGKIGKEFGKISKPVKKQAHLVAKSFGDMVNAWNSSAFGKVVNDGVIAELKGLGEFITWFTKGSINTIGGFLSWIWKSTKSIFQSIGGIFSGGFKSLRGIFETFSGLFSGNWSKMWKGMEDTFFGVTHIFGSIGGGIFKVFDNTFRSIGNSVGKTFDWIVIKAEHAGEMMLHPIKAFRGELDFQKQAAQDQQNTISKAQKQQQKQIMSGNALNNQAPKDKAITQWTPLVKSNLKKLHLSTSKGMVNKVLRQINTESSGIPSQIGGDDGDKRNGRSSGLMQVKPTTFQEYGHGNLMNPNSNIYAALNYGKHRYGNNLSGIGNIGKNGVGLGFGNGGWSSSPAIFGEVSGQPEVAINPAKDSADTLIQQAIQARSKYNKSQANKSSVGHLQGNISEMMNNKNKGRSSKPVEVTQNFTINGNADKGTISHLSQTTKQAVKSVIDEYFGEKNDAIFNS